jgi:hypothetical protein
VFGHIALHQISDGGGDVELEHGGGISFLVSGQRP